MTREVLSFQRVLPILSKNRTALAVALKHQGRVTCVLVYVDSGIGGMSKTMASIVSFKIEL